MMLVRLSVFIGCNNICRSGLLVVGRGKRSSLGVVKVASLSKTTKNKRTIHKQTQQVHADAIFSSHRVLTSID